jgi:hypothetical protein
MNYIKHVIRNYDEKHKALCANKIHYSIDFFETILSITKFPELITNPFLELQRPFLIDIYCKAKSLQWSMRRFILRNRKKRMVSCNQYDLSMSVFTDPIELVIQNKKYTFQRQELYKIMYAALLNADIYMIANPVPIKNPYTGIAFTKNMLYLICACIKLHPLFYYYQKCQFNCHDFLLKHEGLIRNHLIEKTVNEYTPVQLKRHVEEMLDEVTLFNFLTEVYEPIVALNDIPLKTMKPLLFHYYYHIYSLNPYQRNIEYKQLVEKLIVLRK